ncbi:uncharacterized protein [Dysidea avara]|uniref:uncharacterized protein isoform X2 n=1 Tax=Dysidea avara TaxID=196820 RepID=UPI00332520E5
MRWLLALIILCLEDVGLDAASDGRIKVTIVTNITSQLLCTNQSVLLTCHADDVTHPSYQWTSSMDQLNWTSSDILVAASDHVVNYTCTVTSENDGKGDNSISILSNGTVPYLYRENFNEEEIIMEGGSVNLTVINNHSITSHWHRTHAPLPDGHVIKYYTIGGTNYSSLTFSNASYSNDGGEYVFGGSNDCGDSDVSVNLNIKKPDVQCFPPGTAVPLISKTVNKSIVEEEVVKLSCIFRGNYDPIDDTVIWSVTPHNGNATYIDDESNIAGFEVTKPQQDCPSSNYSCCRFITTLKIYSIMSLNKAEVKCLAIVLEQPSDSTSYLTVYKRPTLMKGPDSKTLHKHEKVQFVCNIVASSLKYFTNAAWWKNGSPTRLPNKANITLQTSPGNDSSFIYSLIIEDITESDEGTYSCYSYYNQTILSSMGIDHAIESEHKSADLKVEGGLGTLAILGISIGSAFTGLIIIIIIIILLIVFLVYRRYCRKRIVPGPIVRPMTSPEQGDQSVPILSQSCTEPTGKDINSSSLESSETVPLLEPTTQVQHPASYGAATQPPRTSNDPKPNHAARIAADRQSARANAEILNGNYERDGPLPGAERNRASQPANAKQDLLAHESSETDPLLVQPTTQIQHPTSYGAANTKTLKVDILPNSNDEVRIGADGQGARTISGENNENVEPDGPLSGAERSRTQAAAIPKQHLLEYRPHLQAIRDHVVCKVDVMTRIAMPLAAKFGLHECDVVLDGNGYVNMFRQWLDSGNRTWKQLMDFLLELDERQFVTVLQRKIEEKVIYNEMLSVEPSMRALNRIIQEVAPYFHSIGLELGVEATQLRIIETDYQHQCREKCLLMFEKFLEKGNATWKAVIDALRYEELLTLAARMEGDLPKILDDDEINQNVGEKSTEQCPKVNMLLLLLLLQNKIKRVPRLDDTNMMGWLIDVVIVMDRLAVHCHLKLEPSQIEMIIDPQPKPDHRTMCLVRVIKEQGKEEEVYKTLHILYCGNKRTRNNSSATVSHDEMSTSHSVSQPSTTVINHNYYYFTDNLSTAIAGARDHTNEKIEIAVRNISGFDNPLRHHAQDFFNLVDRTSLTPALFSRELLTDTDLETLHLTSMIPSDKLSYLLIKLVRLDDNNFAKFMDCLKIANGHAGHLELYEKLRNYNKS